LTFTQFFIQTQLEFTDPVKIFGHTDARKLFSSATLFLYSDTSYPFEETVSEISYKILQKYFSGREDNSTLKLMNCVNLNELAVYLRATIDPFDDFAIDRIRKRFPKIHLPYNYIEATEANLNASEEFYIQKAMDICHNNRIGYFRR
jgi:hypothetical protein